MDSRGDTDVSSDVSSEIGKDSNKAFFSPHAVVSGCSSPILVRFETLIASHCELPYEWYKDLGIDKASASRIRRGLVVPSKEWRIKIAHYFNVDSTTIWDIDFKKWCELNDAVDGFWDKVAEVKKHG